MDHSACLISRGTDSLFVLDYLFGDVCIENGLETLELCLYGTEGIFVYLSVQFSHLVVSDTLQPQTAAHQASLPITNSQSLPKLMSIDSVMSSNQLILCHPLLLSSIFPRIRVFPNESVLCIRWPKY